MLPMATGFILDHYASENTGGIVIFAGDSMPCYSLKISSLIW